MRHAVTPISMTITPHLASQFSLTTGRCRCLGFTQSHTLTLFAQPHNVLSGQACVAHNLPPCHGPSWWKHSANVTKLGESTGGGSVAVFSLSVRNQHAAKLSLRMRPPESGQQQRNTHRQTSNSLKWKSATATVATSASSHDPGGSSLPLLHVAWPVVMPAALTATA